LLDKKSGFLAFKIGDECSGKRVKEKKETREESIKEKGTENNELPIPQHKD
jgi:hypothetical protein